MRNWYTKVAFFLEIEATLFFPFAFPFPSSSRDCISTLAKIEADNPRGVWEEKGTCNVASVAHEHAHTHRHVYVHTETHD